MQSFQAISLLKYHFVIFSYVHTYYRFSVSLTVFHVCPGQNLFALQPLSSSFFASQSQPVLPPPSSVQPTASLLKASRGSVGSVVRSNSCVSVLWSLATWLRVRRSPWILKILSLSSEGGSVVRTCATKPRRGRSDVAIYVPSETDELTTNVGNCSTRKGGVTLAYDVNLAIDAQASKPGHEFCEHSSLWSGVSV